MANLFDLNGRVALVVGGAGGIGRAQALGLAENGADVVVASRRLDHLESVSDETPALDKRALAVTVDATQADSVERLVARMSRPRVWDRMGLGGRKGETAAICFGSAKTVLGAALLRS